MLRETKFDGIGEIHMLSDKKLIFLTFINLMGHKNNFGRSEKNLELFCHVSIGSAKSKLS